MPEKLTAFGATQSGPMKSTLSIRDGGGSALPKKPNGGRFVPNTAFIWGLSDKQKLPAVCPLRAVAMGHMPRGSHV